MKAMSTTEEILNLTNKYERVESYTLGMLAQKLPSHLKYHNLRHTKDVTDSVVKIALVEEISPWDREFWIMKTAAVLHDIGYLFNEKMHEQAGADFAESLLTSSSYDYEFEDITSIKGIILATKLPQAPKTPLEKIVCDADVANFGRDDFFELGKLLRQELGLIGINKTDREWYGGVLKLLENHNYHTAAAKSLLDDKKQENIEKVKKIIASL